MRAESILALLSMLVLSAAAEPLLADTMRCGVHIISASASDGATMYEVLKKCGEPTYRHGRQWIYESASQITRTLIFNARGRLVDIDAG